MSVDKVNAAIAQHDLAQFLNELDLRCVMSVMDAHNLSQGVGLLFSSLNAAALENSRLKSQVAELTGKLADSYLALRRRELELQEINNGLLVQIHEMKAKQAN